MVTDVQSVFTTFVLISQLLYIYPAKTKVLNNMLVHKGSKKRTFYSNILSYYLLLLKISVLVKRCFQ